MEILLLDLRSTESILSGESWRGILKKERPNFRREIPFEIDSFEIPVPLQRYSQSILQSQTEMLGNQASCPLPHLQC